jgi:hypothetical protein
MPELIAKNIRIEVHHVHFHSIITATIGSCNWVRKLPGRYTDDQAARLWRQLVYGHWNADRDCFNFHRE